MNTIALLGLAYLVFGGSSSSSSQQQVQQPPSNQQNAGPDNTTRDINNTIHAFETALEATKRLLGQK